MNRSGNRVCRLGRPSTRNVDGRGVETGVAKPDSVGVLAVRCGGDEHDGAPKTASAVDTAIVLGVAEPSGSGPALETQSGAESIGDSFTGGVTPASESTEGGPADLPLGLESGRELQYLSPKSEELGP